MNDATPSPDLDGTNEPHDSSKLLPLVYGELRKLAAQKLAFEKPGHTLQPTALVNEAYLRLVGTGDSPESQGPHWDNRGHFFAAAAEAMRRILVDSARRKSRVKHGGELQRVDLNDVDVPVRPLPAQILALDDALTRLAVDDPVAARVVQLHFFAGLSFEAAAETLGLSRASRLPRMDFRTGLAPHRNRRRFAGMVIFPNC